MAVGVQLCNCTGWIVRRQESTPRIWETRWKAQGSQKACGSGPTEQFGQGNSDELKGADVQGR